MAPGDQAMTQHSISGPGLRATIARKGAEIIQLGDEQGREVLWPGTAPWPRHAPNLFPIVGRLKDDRLRHAGREYHLTQHGFARDREFTWLEATPTTCRLELRDDAATRALYPFGFRFEVAYAVAGNALAVTFTAENPGPGVLPASFGAHPAFRWPLQPGIAKTAHRLEFSDDEPGKVRQAEGGLLLPGRVASPILGRVLALGEGLFVPDAVILEAPRSDWVRYSAPGAPAVTVAWDSGFPNLGIWSRADADLLCIEPWHGMASPAGFDGDIMDKPGIMHIPPGEMRRAVHRIAIA